MCGRFVMAVPVAQVAELFDAVADDLPATAAGYNLAPTQEILACRTGADGRRRLDLLTWGLVPAWAKDPAAGARMINARSETVADKPAFRAAYRSRRCLIPADGFYEWRKEGSRKQPYFVHLPDTALLAFAGLWETWRRDGEGIESCTILTRAANDAVRPLHDRMPVVVAPSRFGQWLDPTTTPDPLALADGPLDFALRPVDPKVGNPRSAGPGLLHEVATQGTLFD